jgi:membrane protease subunit HflC
MKTTVVSWLVIAAAIVALLIVTGAFYVVRETDQAIITEFGKPIGEPITTAGIHFKIPFVQEVNRIEKRVLEWDGPSGVMTTKDKLFIVVDAFGRWQIRDPLRYFLRLRDEPSAQSRLNDILGSEMRNTIARHELVELVRTTKDREAMVDETIVPNTVAGTNAAVLPTTLPAIQFGRDALEREISEQARTKLAEFGIDLLDIRFKRINYNPEVSAKIFERMISERRQIADRFRSEGAGEAARILGKKERDLKQIDSEAYQKVQSLEGRADAEASAIYAAAYDQSAAAREFYTFQRALETYRTAFTRGTTMILATDTPFLQFLKGESLRAGAAGATPPKPPAALPPAPGAALPTVPPAAAAAAALELERR